MFPSFDSSLCDIMLKHGFHLPRAVKTMPGYLVSALAFVTQCCTLVSTCSMKIRSSHPPCNSTVVKCTARCQRGRDTECLLWAGTVEDGVKLIISLSCRTRPFRQNFGFTGVSFTCWKTTVSNCVVDRQKRKCWTEGDREPYDYLMWHRYLDWAKY